MLKRFLTILALLIAPQLAYSGELQDKIDSIDANVIFMRHALAPGIGDPSRFDMDDCSTQRNLDDRGRQQARDLGLYFKDQGVQPTQILSSGWCRCYQTADLLALGDYAIHPGLHSFFDGHVGRRKTLQSLRGLMAELDAQELVLMVTHQVVMTAMTDEFPASGGLILYNSETGQSVKFEPIGY